MRHKHLHPLPPARNGSDSFPNPPKPSRQTGTLLHLDETAIRDTPQSAGSADFQQSARQIFAIVPDKSGSHRPPRSATPFQTACTKISRAIPIPLPFPDGFGHKPATKCCPTNRRTPAISRYPAFHGLFQYPPPNPKSYCLPHKHTGANVRNRAGR